MQWTAPSFNYGSVKLSAKTKNLPLTSSLIKISQNTWPLFHSKRCPPTNSPKKMYSSVYQRSISLKSPLTNTTEFLSPPAVVATLSSLSTSKISMKNFPKASLNLFISLKVEIMSFTTNWVLAIKWPYCNCFLNVVTKKIKLTLKKSSSRKSSLTKFYYLKNLCRTDLFGTGMMTKDSLLIST